MIALHLFFSYTLLGKAFRACSLNRRGAALVGVDARTMSALSFGLSAALGALGGIVIAPMTLTSYDVGMMLGLKGFVAAAMGGFTNQIATVVGGLALGVIESLGAGYISSAYKDAIAMLVLFLVLLGRSFGWFKWGGGE
jgi:branched-chain amino acid transport system permease protein